MIYKGCNPNFFISPSSFSLFTFLLSKLSPFSLFCVHEEQGGVLPSHPESGEVKGADRIPARWPVGYHGCTTAPDAFFYFSLCFPVRNSLPFSNIHPKLTNTPSKSLDLSLKKDKEKLYLFFLNDVTVLAVIWSLMD